MKKIFFRMFILLSVAVMVGFYFYESRNEVKISDLLGANIEALAENNENGDLTVKCYCKQSIFSPKICSANASGAYCGSNDCSFYDGNCR